jgi:hypothetical protein
MATQRTDTSNSNNRNMENERQRQLVILVIVVIDLVQGVLGRTQMEQNLIKLFG